MTDHFAIIAELPLGTFRAHVEGEIPECVPSPARLLSSLLSAAGAGPRSVQADGGTLQPSDEDRTALEWLERTPPDGILVPQYYLTEGDALAYRVELLGTRSGPRTDGGRKKKRRVIERKGKPLRSAAIAGPYAFTWRADPPEGIRRALEELAGDVSHLGMAESPVRLRVGRAVPSHRIDPEAQLWKRGGSDVDLRVARPGRVEALLAAHLADRARPAKETTSENENTVRPPVVTKHLELVRYSAPRPEAPPAPWAVALVAYSDLAVRDLDRVALAGWIHRALVSLIGQGAPPVLTGVYPPGQERPANRCAIQVLGRDELSWLGESGRSAVAMLLPTDCEPGELVAISTAWAQLTTLRGPGGRRWPILRRDQRRADHFWSGPAAGQIRHWRTVPGAVPDVRAQGRDWTLADAICLSVGLVYRDRFEARIGSGRGREWYRALAGAVRDSGVEVIEAEEIRRGDFGRWVHRTPPHLVIRPYSAVLSLGDLAGSQPLVAIGQSRHFAGGLLVPAEMPRHRADTP